MSRERAPEVDRLLPPPVRQLFGERFRWAHEAIGVHTRNRVADIAAALVEPRRWARGVSREELLSAAEAREGTSYLIGWMLRLLEDCGRLERMGDTWRSTEALEVPRPLPDGRPEDLASLEATRRIIDRIADGGLDVLRGVRRGEEVLFSRETFGLWFRYFSNENLLYEPNNRLAALVLADELEPGARIVELGGGTGSAGVALAEEVTRRKPRPWPESYLFTELAPAFERRGGRMVRAAWPERVEVEPRVLDFDRPLVEQQMPAGSFDVVWAVNALHAARDLESSLRSVHEVLRPGGLLVLGECVRPHPGVPVFTEFLFAFLESYRSVPIGPLRSTPGFLTAEEWRANLEVTGFDQIRVVPEIERIQELMPEFLVAVVVARKKTRP